MRFPKYWATGTFEKYSCWGFSDRSLDEAREVGCDRARAVAQHLTRGAGKADQYGYSDRPLREEVVREITGRGESKALISRNRYGAAVLNCASLMFLDIDFEDSTKTKSPGFIASLFGAKKTEPLALVHHPEIKKIENWSWNNPSWGLRVYRTAAGLRLAVTHELFDPEKIHNERICSDLNVDSLYLKLCKAQQSFRARLSPKPWRIGLSGPPASWPFINDSAKNVFLNWEEEYGQRSKEYAVCEFVKSYGNGKIHPEFSQLISLHDELTKANSKLPLA